MGYMLMSPVVKQNVKVPSLLVFVFFLKCLILILTLLLIFDNMGHIETKTVHTASPMKVHTRFTPT